MSLVEAPRVKVGWSTDDAASIRLYRTRRRDHTDGLQALLSDARATLHAPVGLGGGLAAEEAGDSCG